MEGEGGGECRTAFCLLYPAGDEIDGLTAAWDERFNSADTTRAPDRKGPRSAEDNWDKRQRSPRTCPHRRKYAVNDETLDSEREDGGEWGPVGGGNSALALAARGIVLDQAILDRTIALGGCADPSHGGDDCLSMEVSVAPDILPSPNLTLKAGSAHRETTGPGQDPSQTPHPGLNPGTAPPTKLSAGATIYISNALRPRSVGLSWRSLCVTPATPVLTTLLLPSDIRLHPTVCQVGELSDADSPRLPFPEGLDQVPSIPFSGCVDCISASTEKLPVVPCRDSHVVPPVELRSPSWNICTGTSMKYTLFRRSFFLSTQPEKRHPVHRIRSDLSIKHARGMEDLIKKQYHLMFVDAGHH